MPFGGRPAAHSNRTIIETSSSHLLCLSRRAEGAETGPLRSQGDGLSTFPCGAAARPGARWQQVKDVGFAHLRVLKSQARDS